MALSNIYGWSENVSETNGTACGSGDKLDSACGSGDKFDSACGSGDKFETSSACGSEDK